MRKHVAEQHKDSRKEMGDMLLAQLTDSMDHLTFEVTAKGLGGEDNTKFPIYPECYLRCAREKGLLPKFNIDAYEDTQ